ncbi:hypothetical protein EV356DRAFT_514305 [Viridothelium virens]|uniref:F-box domain-containing protein n=1 Tax=Viridothelium virens TaxID=1048519 RepID=A0A6A6HDC2_VIRVR|nr:hypothetical protein EV356DRAFT_514305 [Viridothelium virens]
MKQHKQRDKPSSTLPTVLSVVQENTSSSDSNTASLHLPNELWLQIFHDVDSKALFSCMLVCSNWHTLIDQALDWHTIDLTPWFYRRYNAVRLDQTSTSPKIHISDLSIEIAVQQRIVNATRLQLQIPYSEYDRVLLHFKSEVSTEMHWPVPGNLFWILFSMSQSMDNGTAKLRLRCPNLQVIQAAIDFVVVARVHDHPYVERIMPVLGNFDAVAPNLTELDLSDSHLCSYWEPSSHVLFPNSPNLRILRLDRAREFPSSRLARPLIYGGVWQWIGRCAKLEVLSLVDTIFEEYDLRCLLCIRDLHLLKELDLSWTGHLGSFPLGEQSLLRLKSYFISRMEMMLMCRNPEHQACRDVDGFVPSDAGGGTAHCELYKVKLVLRGQLISLNPTREEIRRSLNSIGRTCKVVGLNTY